MNKPGFPSIPFVMTVATVGAVAILWQRMQKQPQLQQMQSLIYPTPSTFPLHTRKRSNYESNFESTDNNASALHGNTDLDNAPLRHPEQQRGVRITDEKGTVVFDDNDTLKPPTRRAVTTGFAVRTWDNARGGSSTTTAEIVYLGKGFLFERYPLSTSGQGVLRLASGLEKVNTPHLPYLDWAGERRIIQYSATGDGRFLSYNTAMPEHRILTHSIQYLSPKGDRRIMTSVPTLSRLDAPTVKMLRDGDVVSDYPLVFRVWRQTEATQLDTDKLYVLNWQHVPVLVTITAGRRFQWRNPLTSKPLGAPRAYFEYMSPVGEKLRAHVRPGNALSFVVEDADTTIGDVHDSITFLGPREESFTVRLVPLRDMLESEKIHLQ